MHFAHTTGCAFPSPTLAGHLTKSGRPFCLARRAVLTLSSIALIFIRAAHGAVSVVAEQEGGRGR